jgi:hypothetical protein
VAERRVDDHALAEEAAVGLVDGAGARGGGGGGAARRRCGEQQSEQRHRGG